MKAQTAPYGRIIAVTNQKGGVGKSATAQAIAAACALMGYRTLLVDLDPQGNTTTTFADIAAKKHPTIFGALMRENRPRDVWMDTPFNFELMPSSPMLAQADLYLTETGKEFRLKEVLAELHRERDYDFIVIDTQPALGVLVVNALAAADTVVIPTTGDLYAMQGVRQLYDTIKTVRKYCNPDLKIGGILFTQFDGRRNLTKEVYDLAEDLSIQMNTRVFRTKIRNSQAVRDAQAIHTTLFKYAPKSTAARDYRDFTEELIYKVMDVKHSNKTKEVKHNMPLVSEDYNSPYTVTAAGAISDTTQERE